MGFYITGKVVVVEEIFTCYCIRRAKETQWLLDEVGPRSYQNPDPGPGCSPKEVFIFVKNIEIF